MKTQVESFSLKITRREFFSRIACSGVSGCLLGSGCFDYYLSQGKRELTLDKESQTRRIFSKIMARAKREAWPGLPIGECMGKIAISLLGTRYVAGTLEGEGPEVCRVDLSGMDCVTFYENVLCLARILKKGQTAFDDFIAELTFVRYRGGCLMDYTSRLHYTADWIFDNEKKRVVENITPHSGGERFPVRVFFMSNNSRLYPALRSNPQFIPVIARQEEDISKRSHWIIPRENIEKVQTYLQTGDIVAFAASRQGLDYGHAGLVYRGQRGKVGLLHASSKKMRVILDGELVRWIQSVETCPGVTVARPVEVRTVREWR